MHLVLHLLGPFQATVDHEAIPESRSKKIEALLAILATEADYAHRRENLVGLLFPELDDEQARTNLRQTLTRLRRAIQDKDADPPFLLVTRESTQFNANSDCEVDLWAFTDLVVGCTSHRGRREEDCADCMRRAADALSFYRGPFLEGLFLEDSAPFEDWVVQHRERLEQEALLAAEQLSDYHERRGEYERAIIFAEQQLAIDPWREQTHRQLMRLYAYQGQRNLALRQYEKLSTLLSEELGLQPMAETQSLRQQIARLQAQRPHSLPVRPSPLVGRREELALINAHLAHPYRRLVSLIGPGGVGKTALAIDAGWRVAEQYLGPFVNGVFFVPLVSLGHHAGTSSTTAIATAIAEALSFSFAGPTSAVEQLVAYLHDKTLLLILDNAEHLLESVQTLAQRLLNAAPGIKLLLTSRERLRLADEWVLEVRGLAYPDQQPLQRDASYDAVTLFVQRAQRHEPRFRLAATGEPGEFACSPAAVEEICRLLEGLPLGIELAANWVRVLTCDEIAAEISRSLDFLATTAPDVAERHRSLRAIFDSTWELLSEAERRSLRRLAVCRAGFDRQAAEAVSGVPLDELARLVDVSLLRRTGDGPTVRYSMLEILRQYALRKQSTAESAALQAQHMRHYLGLLMEHGEALRGGPQQLALTLIAREIENIRFAWDHAVEQRQFVLLAEASNALGLFYYMRSWFAEGAARFSHMVDVLGRPQDALTRFALGRVLLWQGWFDFLRNRQQEGEQELQSSVELLGNAGDDQNHSLALSLLGVVRYSRGDYASAEDLAQKALALSTSAGDRYGRAIANNVLSQIAYLCGEYAQARRYSEKSLALEQAIENRWSMGFSLTNLGRAAYAAGEYAQAARHFQDGLRIREELRDVRGQALCHLYLGNTAMAQGDEDAATAAYTASLTLFKEIGNLAGIATVRLREGLLAQERQEPQQAFVAFRDSLLAAQQAGAAPRALEAVAALGQLLTAQEPEIAARAAALVRLHPAASPESLSMVAGIPRGLEPPAPEPVDAALARFVAALQEEPPPFFA